MRMSYQRQKEVLEMPNLIEVQKDSYKWFLDEGLKAVSYTHLAKYGSTDPAAIVGPGILATGISTIAAVIFCKIMDRKKGRSTPL